MHKTSEPELMVRLLERRRLTATRERTAFEESTVHCPIAVEARGVRSCRSCERFGRELEEGGQVWLECNVPVAVAFPRGVCGELMSAEVTCLDIELDAARAAEFLELAGLSSAPVLDDNAVLVGVVTRPELTRVRVEQSAWRSFADGALEVEDAMTTELVTLSQRSTVGDAARLMAARGLDRVPIVTDDGHLVGIICAMDLVRWLAGRIP